MKIERKKKRNRWDNAREKFFYRNSLNFVLKRRTLIRLVFFSTLLALVFIFFLDIVIVIMMIIIRCHAQSSLHWSHISNEISIHSLLMRFHYGLCFSRFFPLSTRSTRFFSDLMHYINLHPLQSHWTSNSRPWKTKKTQKNRKSLRNADHNRKLCKTWCYQSSFCSSERHIVESFSSLTNSNLIRGIGGNEGKRFHSWSEKIAMRREGRRWLWSWRGSDRKKCSD